MKTRAGDAADTAPMRQVTQLALAGVPTAVGCARAFVRCVLHQWRLAHLVETAELLMSELVTNAVKTSGSADASPRSSLVDEVHLIHVRLVLAESLFIDVWDRDPRAPTMQEPELDAEGGRGLFLVDCMSRRWGCHHPPGIGSKIVWCELDSVPPTTKSGLPIRAPATVPAQRIDLVDDLAILRRVLERLRRLQ